MLDGGISVVGIDYIHYKDRFYSLFNCDRALVNQALLTIGDYSLQVVWRYQVGSKKIDATWKTLFHTNKDNIQKIHNILITLLDKSETFNDDILKDIIDEYLSSTTSLDWRYYLVKYDSMRPEKYGMYYWYDYKTRGKQSYKILMMMTEKSIGGKNYDIFLKTLKDRFSSIYPDKVIRLGNFAYQGDGDKLEISYKGKIAYYQENSFIIEDVSNPESKIVIGISQENGIDIVDRIDIAWNEISKLIQTS